MHWKVSNNLNTQKYTIYKMTRAKNTTNIVVKTAVIAKEYCVTGKVKLEAQSKAIREAVSPARSLDLR